MLGRFKKVLGGQNREPKSIFGRFFAMLFSSAFWNRFFGDFLVIFLYPNLDFCAHSQCFATIYTKSTFSKKMRKNIDFGRFLGGVGTLLNGFGRFSDGFGRFLHGFGRFWGDFWEILGLV